MNVKAVLNGRNIYFNEIAMILAGNTGILLVINHTYHSLSLECLLCKVKLVNSWTFNAFWENKSLAYIYFVVQLQGGGTLLQNCWWGVRRVSEDNVRFSRPYFRADPKLGILLQRKSHECAQTETISDQNIRSLYIK